MSAITSPAPSAKTSGATGKRIPELDGVRGLAIALVLLYHYAQLAVPEKSALYYLFLPTHLMWSGVDLFFVLSGLLIGGILLDNRESEGYYSVFYLRRLHRIFPLYYLMIAVLVLGIWLMPRSPLFMASMPLWAYPLYAQNLLGDFTRAAPLIGVTWSLAVEEQFYLLFPAIVRLFSRKTLIAFLGVCIIGAPLLRTAMVLHGQRMEQIYPLLPCRADALALGVAAAIILRSAKAKAWVEEHRKLLYGCMTALLLAMPTLLKWTTFSYLGTIGYSIVDVMYFLLIVLLLVAPFPALTNFFRARWLGWLGVVSYCVYLIHQPVRDALFLLFGLDDRVSAAGLATFAVSLLSLAATLAIAQVSWVFLEKPLVDRAHVRYRYVRSGR